MTTASTAPAAATRTTSPGRRVFRAAIVLSLLSVAVFLVQFALKQLFTPWYVPIALTLAVLLVFYASSQRRTLPRLITLGLLVVVAGLSWFFLLVLARLPDYQGPGASKTIPAFQTTRADGRPFTDKDLKDGQASVVVFFRGRW